MVQGLDQFIWHEIFVFPSDAGRVESVVWRSVIITDAELNNLGCAEAADARANGKPAIEYRGSMTARAGDITQLKTTRGHGFSLHHVPEDGRKWHVHIKVEEAPNTTVSKNDKSDIRALMQKEFLPFYPHVCPGRPSP